MPAHDGQSVGAREAAPVMPGMVDLVEERDGVVLTADRRVPLLVSGRNVTPDTVATQPHPGNVGIDSNRATEVEPVEIGRSQSLDLNVENSLDSSNRVA